MMTGMLAKLALMGITAAAVAPILRAQDIEPQPALTPAITFDPSQRRFFDDRSRVIVVNWHRQKGKDFTAAAKAVDHALATHQTWYIVSLTQRQADATFAKCKQVARTIKELLGIVGEDVESEYASEQYDRWLDEHFVFTAREIRFPGGGRVVSLPGRDPDTLAGLTGNIIFTEFGLFPGGGYDHWRVVFPLTTRGFSCIVISTPRGKNTKFYELFTNSEGDYSVHFCDIYKSVAEDGFVLRDNHGVACSIEKFKKLYGDPVGFDREYGCLFTGDLQALIAWSQLEEAGKRGRNLPFDLLIIKDGAGWNSNFFRKFTPVGGRFEIGWDVARTGDLSVFWVNHSRSAVDRYLRFLVLMHNCEFALQRAVGMAAMDARGFGSGVGCGDSTGLGMDSNEFLATRYRERWEPVNFASKKGELAATALAAYRDNTQALPPTDGPHKFIAADVYAIQRVAGEEGKVTGDDKTRKLKITETVNPMLEESHCDLAYGNFLSLRAASNPASSKAPAPMARKPEDW